MSIHKHTTTHASAAVLRKHNILVDLHMQTDRQLVSRSQTQKLDIQTSQTQPSCENNIVFYSDKMVAPFLRVLRCDLQHFYKQNWGSPRDQRWQNMRPEWSRNMMTLWQKCQIIDYWSDIEVVLHIYIYMLHVSAYNCIEYLFSACHTTNGEDSSTTTHFCDFL